MTKELFPTWCRHFVENLPKGMGKGGKAVILIFDGHASRWNFAGLQYLLENNVFCLCLPGHTSIWAQPNDCGPNASLKSRLGDAVAQYRASHRLLPGIEGLNKLTRGNFNQIFVQAWLTFQQRSQLDLAQLGKNAIKSGWKATGLCPYNRKPPNWEAAIARFGQREEVQITGECEMPRGAAQVLPLAHSNELEQMFRAAAAKRAAPSAPESPQTAPKAGVVPATTPSTGGAPVSTTGAGSVTGAQAANAAETAVTPQAPSGATTAAPTVPEPPPAASQAGAAPVAEPSTAEAPAASPVAAMQAEQAAQLRNEFELDRRAAFMSRLENMEMGSMMELLPAGDLQGEEAASAGSKLWRCKDGYSMLGKDGSMSTLTLGECDSQLAPRYALPTCGTEDLSAEEKHARRVKEAKLAAAMRRAEMEAAVRQATLEWQWQQAELAAELGISYKAWMRITKLLSAPPAKQVSKWHVMNSVAVGEAVVISAAVHGALTEPLRESVRHAKERSAAEPAGAKKKREPQITQTPFGMDVTEMMPLLQAASERQQGDAAAKQRRQEEAAAAKARNASSAAARACQNLLGKNDADKLSIGDLCALIKWRNGAVPKDTSKNGKPALVRTWRDLAVSEEAIRAESASAEASQASAPTQRKKQKRRAAESDDESSSEEESDEEGEDESDDDEQWSAKAVIKRKGKGKTLQYLVDWEPELDQDGNVTQTWNPTWEKPEDISDDLIDDFEAERTNAL